MFKDAKSDRWIRKIEDVKEDAVVIYTDGSMSEEGRIEGGWRSEGGKVKRKIGIGKMTTVVG